ncbi:MAG: primosomal protein N' [Solirubrobacteraceae bacterium]
MSLNLKYIEVILPISLGNTFTYSVPIDIFGDIAIGLRVTVPFGRGLTYTGIIYKIDVPEPELYKTKEIYHIIDKSPIVSVFQIKLWEWVASYYCSNLGTVYKNLFPSYLRLDSEHFLKINPEKSIKHIQDHKIIDLLSFIEAKQIVSIKELESILDKKQITKIVNNLLLEGIILIEEKLTQKYRRKVVNYIHPNLLLLEKSDKNEALFKLIEKSPKQREVLLKIIAGYLKNNKNNFLLQDFLKENNLTKSSINPLIEKNLIVITTSDEIKEKQQQIEIESFSNLENIELNNLIEVEKKLEQSNVLLVAHELFSQKDKIIFKLIEKYINKGKKVLYLFPSVYQANFYFEKLASIFPQKVLMYHSGENQNTNTDNYLKVLQNNFSIIIGVRSVPFLPFNKLSLVLVEHEQDELYKQREAKPYFNARESAIMLANIIQAKCILLSLSPSVESYYNSKQKKFSFHKIDSLEKEKLPVIKFIDTKLSTVLKGTISEELRLEIEKVLKTGRKALIYQNRKGYAPILECNDCGHTPYCPSCDVSLTYYKEQNVLKCHYCGYKQEKPNRCFVCNGKDLLTKGIGIEQIEKDLVLLFPDKKIVKLTTESINKKLYLDQISEELENGGIDILIGTKALLRLNEFKNIGLLAMVKIDADLNQNNIRAHEATFQNVLRFAQLFPSEMKEKKIVLQTTTPEHLVLQNLSEFTYTNLLDRLIEERKTHFYPPFSKLIQIRLKHAKYELVDKVANELKKRLEYGIKENVLGPESPYVSKIRNEFIKNILIKITPQKSTIKIKKYILEEINKLGGISNFKQVKIEVDIDPLI